MWTKCYFSVDFTPEFLAKTKTPEMREPVYSTHFHLKEEFKIRTNIVRDR